MQEQSNETKLDADARARLQIEIRKIEAFRRNGKLRKNWIYLGPHVDSFGMTNYSLFDFSWRGASGDLEGGVYNAQFQINGHLSYEPPKAKMLDKFLHMHVYGHGEICFPFVDRSRWKPSTTLIDVAQELEDMLNLPPDITSPAHYNMKELYNKSPEEYFKHLREQAKSMKDNQPTQYFKQL